MKRFATFFVVLCAAIIVQASISFAQPFPGRLVVKFKPGIVKAPKGLGVASIRAAAVSAASVKALNARFGVSGIRKLYQDALLVRPDWKQLEDQYLLIYSGSAEAGEVAAEYKKDGNIESAFADSIVRAFQVTPNDTYYVQQWALSKISAPQGWIRTTGSTDELIAVLDTGINYNHEDFTGKVDLVHAKDYVNLDDDPMDDFGHGTAVSGIAAAATNNSKGIAGVNWKAIILPIKVLDSSGGGSMSSVTDALAYLTALKSTGLNIAAINMSLGQYNSGLDKYVEENPGGLKDRCQEAYDQGIVLVAAAGNGNVDWNTYPAYYPTVISAAATDSSDKRSVWSGTDPETGRIQASNYGSWVRVSAPGSALFTTNKDGGYSNPPTVPLANGTSFSSPHVAGLAVLLRAAKPSLTVAEIMYRIQSTCDNIDAVQDTFYRGKLGAGRINTYLALSGLASSITSPASGEYVTGTIGITGTAAGWDFSAYTLEAVRAGSVEATITSSAASVESGLLGSWNSSAHNGEYLIRLRVFAADQTSREADSLVFVDNQAPTAQIANPVAGATVEGRVTFTGSAEDQYFDHYTLEYGQGATPASYQSLGTFYSPVSNGVLGTWESAGLQGNYAIRLRVYDRVLHSSQVLLPVTVSPLPPTKEVVPVAGLPPTFALPNPFDRQITSEVALVYDLKGNFNTSIYLYDLNGSLIWRENYPAGANGGKAGRNFPAWDGRDLFQGRVPDGVYYYQVTADRKVIGRGKIIVLN